MSLFAAKELALSDVSFGIAAMCSHPFHYRTFVTSISETAS